MKTRKGNLITMALHGEFDIIAHGANCQCIMGAGIAKQIKGIFPEAWEADKKTFHHNNNKKLGEFTSATVFVKNGRKVSRDEIEAKPLIIANLYTQVYPGTSKNEEEQENRYKAIETSLAKLKLQFPNKSIGLPLIGAGLAGGDWNVISKIFEKIYPEATIIEFDNNPKPNVNFPNID
jgi:O-acetyl-ADP-ribose deacetylase (regulator of RNase III)